MKRIPTSTTRLCECLFDITTVATWLMHQQRISVDDSRNLFQTCLELAQRFEEDNPNIGDEYMERVEEYAEEKLLEKYGGGNG